MKSTTHLFNSAQSAFVAAMFIVALGILTFFAFEPSIGHSQQYQSNFTVSQTITSELSFLVQPSNVTMNGSIAGLTGGYATGTTVTSVRTNNTLGYNMKLHFATTTSGQAMQASSTAYINDYSPAVNGTPDYEWQMNTVSAEFGYTVRASTTGEVDPSFRNNGSACNAGTNENDDRCWMRPTTTAAQQETILNSASANNNSTTTIKFRVAVPSNPSPALPATVYAATGTLTITAN